MLFSVIIPVYNRPEEVRELLESFVKQSFSDYEIILVEDGSSVSSKEVFLTFESILPVKYFEKSNSGPGQSRNYGADRAEGDWLIFLDSDCILPENYLNVLDLNLSNSGLDAFGGPDAGHPDFSPVQKAISITMTSFLTTGGIRGGGEKMDKFHPRSFNMGYTKEVYKTTGGFSKLRFGEDIDMSVRILKAGFKTGLIKDAWVYHKRRTDLKKFFKQVYNSGIARINLQKRHPGTLKAVHALPALFVLGVPISIMLGVFLHPLFYVLPLLPAAGLLIEGSLRAGSVYVGYLTIAAGYVQLIGYGTGFLYAFYKRYLLGEGEFDAFRDNFYE
jgi:glycosyltransferase involved in cell wall biosynthesis